VECLVNREHNAGLDSCKSGYQSAGKAAGTARDTIRCSLVEVYSPREHAPFALDGRMRGQGFAHLSTLASREKSARPS
jgi:hypothetical protein